VVKFFYLAYWNKEVMIKIIEEDELLPITIYKEDELL